MVEHEEDPGQALDERGDRRELLVRDAEVEGQVPLGEQSHTRGELRLDDRLGWRALEQAADPDDERLLGERVELRLDAAPRCTGAYATIPRTSG